ncbi:MAG: Bug family tripartite tricarboxylate transporter substrate binding protein [Burkholderiales bacterium]
MADDELPRPFAGERPASYRPRRRFVLLSLACLAWTPAAGQTRFPTKPVRILVPFPAGQAADTIARILAQHLSVAWGQQVIVENRGGGLGIPAMLAAKNAAPDGHTLMMGTTGSLCINPALHSNIPYDVQRDFVPVGNVVIAPLIIIAHPSFPATTVRELVAMAKSSPKPVQFASAGIGTSQHMTGELFAARTGIKLQHIPYKGSAPAITDLMGGQVMVMVDSVVSALPHIKSGKVRALAVTTGERIPQLPSVPTVAEAGYPGFEGYGWASIVAPAKTPEALVAKISGDIQQALRDPQLRAEFIERGGIPAPSTPSQLAEFLRAETQKWSKLARDANIRLEE